jgi:ABC-type transport system involved in multi-copper enzyme maturation permease subunit
MILQSITIARNSFIESVRQPVLFLLVLLAGFLQFLTTWNTGFSMGQTETGEVSGDNKLMFELGLASVFLISTILAGFIATAIMSREIENKTILTIVSKPVSRVSVIIGKYLGVVGALLLALTIMVIFLLMGIRHGVMSTTADELDGPVIVFTGLAIFASLALAGWCNFFYGWSFPQTAVTFMAPLLVVAYLLVLGLGKGFKPQPFGTDIKIQILIACVCLSFAVLVLSAVATAASTRLGQVMTITVCFGVFVASLLSNHVLGRHVFDNKPLAMIKSVESEDLSRSFSADRVAYRVVFDRPIDRAFARGDAVYYGPSPSGFPIMTPGEYPRFTGNLDEANDWSGPQAQPSIVSLEGDANSIRVRNIGSTPLDVVRPPEPGDYIFSRPTETRPALLMLWGALPNVQFFWLVDAVSQNRVVPMPYVGIALVYSLVQIVGFLSLAVLLFQRRDVG